MKRLRRRMLPAGIFFMTALVFFLTLVLSPQGVGAQGSAAAKESAKLPRLVDVGADKCIPCIMMAPILEELKKEYAGVLIVEFVDVWKNPQGAKQYRVRGIPTQIFFDANGKELKRHGGFISKQGILDQFQQLGIPLKPDAKKGT